VVNNELERKTQTQLLVCEKKSKKRLDKRKKNSSLSKAELIQTNIGVIWQ